MGLSVLFVSYKRDPTTCGLLCGLLSLSTMFHTGQCFVLFGQFFEHHWFQDLVHSLSVTFYSPAINLGGEPTRNNFIFQNDERILKYVP